jgi:putative sigma-54 modulation protein
MKLLLHGKNIEITDAIREYVHQKIEKAVSHFENFTTEVDVHLSVNRNTKVAERQVAEVTVYANGTVIRVQEAAEILYASIDLVADKISRKLRKYKEKNFVAKKTHHSLKEQSLDNEIESEANAAIIDFDLVGDRAAELPEEVVRVKYFSMQPMSVKDAWEHLQMVGHDFYMFCNSDTSEINVIYQRNHGGYGVIQPRPEEQMSMNGFSDPKRAVAAVQPVLRMRA